MAQDILSAILRDLFAQMLMQMAAEPPAKLHGEAQRIESFGFEAFQGGFLYGLKAGIGVTGKGRGAKK